jgi:hypothetical protein
MGYEKMAELAVDRIRVISEVSRPSDMDNDGVYDFAEEQRGMDIASSDSDSDGVSDSQELFVYGTNPLNGDTDGDTLPDALEVLEIHSNPLSAIPGSPEIVGLQVVLSGND